MEDVWHVTDELLGNWKPYPAARPREAAPLLRVIVKHVLIWRKRTKVHRSYDFIGVLLPYLGIVRVELNMAKNVLLKDFEIVRIVKMVVVFFIIILILQDFQGYTQQG